MIPYYKFKIVLFKKSRFVLIRVKKNATKSWITFESHFL
jgi:hypothetical protein